jgi:hypothetical protein
MSDNYVDPVALGKLQSGSLEETVEALKKVIPRHESLIATHQRNLFALDTNTGQVIERSWQRDGDDLSVSQERVIRDDLDVVVGKLEYATLVEDRLHQSLEFVQTGKNEQASQIVSSFTDMDLSGVYESVLRELRNTDWTDVELELDPSVDIHLFESNQSGSDVYEAANMSSTLSDIEAMLEDWNTPKTNRLCEIAGKSKRLVSYKETNQQNKQILHDEIVDAFNTIAKNIRAML